MKTTLWILFAFLCISIGLYPIIFFVVDWPFGLLLTKPAALLRDTAWKTGFYTHIVGGGIALLVGWTQFSTRWRTRYTAWHRRIGKLYVAAVLAGAIAGIFIGFNATGGPVARAGFITLGIIWFLTTLAAFLYIRKGDVARHRVMMTYSYAACFAAVTLRLWIPVLMLLFDGEYLTAYRTVAWLCWVPNLGVAWWMTRVYTKQQP